MSEEIWKPIEWFSYYEVSSFGRVRSLWGKPKIKIPFLSKEGYFRVRLFKSGKGKNFSIHRLVLKSFILNPENKPQVNHIGGNKLNNTLSNLEWVTVKENANHADSLGLVVRGENMYSSKLKNSDVYFIIKHKNIISQTEISKILNISISAINNVIHGRSWNHITNIPKNIKTIKHVTNRIKKRSELRNKKRKAL